MPGDALLVEIMDVQPFADRPWGFTGIFDKSNGGGFLDEIYPSAYVNFLAAVYHWKFMQKMAFQTLR
jgi:acetamidase/formamidase